MKFSRKHYVVGFIGNLIVFAVGMVGIVMLLLEHYDLSKVFLYFTTLSNVLVVLCSLVNAILFLASAAKKKNYVKEFFQVLKMIAVVSVAITFTMVVVFLAPNNSTNFDLFGGSQLFLHLITPIVAVFSFVFFEYSVKIRFRFFFTPIILVLLYGAFYVIYAFVAPAGTPIDWYGFMFEASARVAPADASKFTTGMFLIFLGESFGAALVYGFLAWLLNKIMNLIFIGYTITPESESEEEYYDEVDEAAVKEEDEKVQEEVESEVKEEPTKKIRIRRKSKRLYN